MMISAISRTMKTLAMFSAAFLLLSPALSVPARAQAARRLILTDGSFQVATEWKKEGDRLSYFSAERGEWEELPTALVDWKATDEWNASHAKATQEELKQVTAEEIAARKEAMLNTPEVAPGLRLPAEGGIYLFVPAAAGQPTLSHLPGSKIQIDEHTGTTMLKRSVMPIASQISTLEVAGASAKVHLHTPTPAIYLDVDNEDGVIAGDNFRIVRLERKHEQRVVAKQKTNFAGQQETTQHFLKARAEKFSGDWWKLIPLEDLTPGEYAIVLDLPSSELNSVVWDFAIDK